MTFISIVDGPFSFSLLLIVALLMLSLSVGLASIAFGLGSLIHLFSLLHL